MLKKFIPVFAIAACLFAGDHSAPRTRLWVATVICDADGSFQVLSFVDAETSEEAVRGNLAAFITGKYPSGKLISVRIEPVSEEIVDRIVKARTAGVRF